MGVRLTKAHNQHLSQRLVHAGWSHAAVAVRYGLLSLVALAMVGWVAPRFGLLPCLAISAAVLLLHLTHAIRAARDVPYRF